MRILIDMVHPADVNFYKRAVHILEKEHDITLVVLERGRLHDIVRKEYPGRDITLLGRHRKSGIAKLFGLIDRELLFFTLFLNNRYDRVTSFGFYPAIAAKPFGIRSVLFTDDIEYRKTWELITRFGDCVAVPRSLCGSGERIWEYNGFKELAYLYHFRPNPSVLDEYGIANDRFVFVREMAGVSMNYYHLEKTDLTHTFRDLRRKGYRILYYGEAEKMREMYKDTCIILKEPISDILSLLHYSRFVLTSGDTIAREAALLGTPAIYFGKRKMLVNGPLIRMGAIIEADDLVEVEKSIGRIIGHDKRDHIRSEVLHNIDNVWDNTTNIIVDSILA